MNEREEAHVERGQQRLQAGDLEGAIDDFSAAIQSDPSEWLAWMERGAVLAQKLDLEGAVRDIRTALDLAPVDWSLREKTEALLQKLEIKTLTLPKTIREFAARKKYRSIDAAVIASIPDDKLVQALVDYVVDFEIRGDVARSREIVSTLPAVLRGIYAMWLVDVEVHNGGFAQFFSLFAPFAADALEGYRAIGSPRAALLERAIAANGEFGSLDREFAEMTDDDNARRVTWIRANVT